MNKHTNKWHMRKIMHDIHKTVSSFSSLNTSSTSLYSENESLLSDNEEITDVNGLRVYYTNADNLLNKFDEFEIILCSKNIDVAVVTEVFPQNIKATNIDPHEYYLNNYQCFTSKLDDNSRGVVIYVKNDISAEQCNQLKDCMFTESVWIVLKPTNDNKTNILLGGIYKSPSSNAANQKNLNVLLSKAAALNYEKLIILGDF